MLYLIRHGTTTFNSRGENQEVVEKIRGWLPLSLDEDGKNQAIAAGEALRDKNIQQIYTSTLKRAVETADEISKILNMPHAPTGGLTPWNIGRISGRLVRHAIPIMSGYFKLPLIDTPDGESYSLFYNRWKFCLFSLIDEAKTKNICAVTHSRNLYCMNHILTEGVSPIIFTGLPVPGGIVEIDPLTLKIRIL